MAEFQNTDRRTAWADGSKTPANEKEGDSKVETVHRKRYEEQIHIVRCIDAYPNAGCPGHATAVLRVQGGVKQLKGTHPFVRCQACGRWLQIKLRWMLVAARPPEAPDVPRDPTNPTFDLSPSFLERFKPTL